MILFACVLLIVGVLLVTLLVRQKDLPEPAPVSPFQHLDELKARIYDNLRDLQFEYRVGKLSDEDYQKTKTELQRELAGVMAQIDQIKAQLGQAPKGTKPAAAPPPAPVSNSCPHCGASFPQTLKFCGECGRPMSGVSA
jgi:hypothetical protein